jgi:hypothetical protein
MIQWGLSGGNNALGMFQMGAQIGQNLRQRQEDRARDDALRSYASNPQAPNALAPVIQADPRLGLQLQQQRAEQASQQAATQQQQRRADMPILSRLLDHATDETTYQQARQAAASYGIDVSGIPANYDANWVGQQKMLLKAVQTPQGQEALSTAGRQAMDLGYRPGTPEFTQITRQLVEASLAQAYTGSQGETRLYTPQIGGPGQVQGGPQVGTIEEGYRFKGGNPADPSAWEPVMSNEQGGATLSAASQSRSITAEEAARIRQSLGPNGQSAFESWLRDNNIVIGAR